MNLIWSKLTLGSSLLPSSFIQPSAVPSLSLALRSLVPSSSLPSSLWCHSSLAPGGEGGREEGM